VTAFPAAVAGESKLWTKVLLKGALRFAAHS
jgi:hypothetical protein